MRAALLAAVAMVAVAACGATDSTLTIENGSSFTIIEINVAPVNQVTWGADLLGGDVLYPGESVEITGIECDDYDVRVIDEDNDECVLEGVELCVDDAVWAITDTELAACAFGG